MTRPPALATKASAGIYMRSSSVVRFLSSRWGSVLTGTTAGVLAPILVKLGNPGNIGICMACISHDSRLCC